MTCLNKQSEALGRRIRRLREAAGLSKAELAKRVGVSDVAVGYWESGESKTVNSANLVSLGIALGISVSDLLDDPMAVDRDEGVARVAELIAERDELVAVLRRCYQYIVTGEDRREAAIAAFNALTPYRRREAGAPKRRRIAS